ncbi:MAG: T9SS type A sorting domain-containing protein [Ignavibacteriae bacterium]|nr:T9SS type A sorting domain-containing protein [Ignavibacteriota bacterium]
MRKYLLNLLTIVFLSIIILGLMREDKNTNNIDNIYPEPDSVYARYFPLSVGNRFVYLYSNFYPGQTWVSRAVITKDSIISGKKYFYCQNFPYISSGWVRFDTATGNLLQRSTYIGCSVYPYDIILDSLRSKINNQVNCVGFKRCVDTNLINMFNLYQKKSINFINDGIIYQVTRYVCDFGIRDGCSGEPPPCEVYYNLKGYVINGIVYGDTTMTGISKINSNIPDKFSLSQNYPNPFNPSTTIKFQITPVLSSPHVLGGGPFMTLKVFDILGKEVATLVNEKLKPGEYEVQFSNNQLTNVQLPSGVYFYSLFADGNLIDTKKLVLLK